jgi:hypothetical protein
MAAKVEKIPKHLSRDLKVAAIELSKANVPLKKIRDQLNISESSLRRILSFARKNPANPISARKKRVAHNLKLTPQALQDIKKALTKNPSWTGKQLKEKIPSLEGIGIRAIQRACKEKLNLPSRKMAKKPLLTQRMKDQRLAFAMQYRHWGIEEWKKVMFSDESHFELHFGEKFSRCRRPVGSDRFDPRFTQKTVKHPMKVMVWGCFSWKGRGGLEFLNQGEMMNGQRYLRLLDEKLELFMGLHNTTHFLQDGAPCHKAKIVTAWFNARPHITLIKWPGNSPDLNPIENA